MLLLTFTHEPRPDTKPLRSRSDKSEGQTGEEEDEKQHHLTYRAELNTTRYTSSLSWTQSCTLEPPPSSRFDQKPDTVVKTLTQRNCEYDSEFLLLVHKLNPLGFRSENRFSHDPRLHISPDISAL
ncbi:hypothetical protein F2P81_013432 [Scophthalmus maximus]|uniref:Uncharacterized protein n=1 Tax=Scophthalmus maximus TaxID=52904 RepID=A0A6A4SE05_SCOMX|nr:hypothetical protein F2P81_013432 [Scophthalmus maximus]